MIVRFPEYDDAPRHGAPPSHDDRVEEEQRILEAAPPHLRVAIILLTQTGGRTYSEGFSLRWDQIDLANKLIHLDNDVKTPGSSEPVPLSEYEPSSPSYTEIARFRFGCAACSPLTSDTIMLVDLRNSSGFWWSMVEADL